MALFLESYLSCDYFLEIEFKQVKKKGKNDPKEDKTNEKYEYLSANLVSGDENNLWIGLKSEGYLNGLGCTYSRHQKKMIEAGFYVNGQLNGYSI